MTGARIRARSDLLDHRPEDRCFLARSIRITMKE